MSDVTQVQIDQISQAADTKKRQERDIDVLVKKTQTELEREQKILKEKLSKFERAKQEMEKLQTEHQQQEAKVGQIETQLQRFKSEYEAVVRDIKQLDTQIDSLSARLKKSA